MTMKSIEDQLLSCMINLSGNTADDDTIIIETTFSYPATFSGFAGHFEGNPVLPAIVQLSSVRFALEQHIGKKLHPETIQRAKFRSMVQPEQQIRINLKVTCENDRYKARFKILGSDTKLISDGICSYSERH